MPNLRGSNDLCKPGKEYLNGRLCKLGNFSIEHSETFDI